MISFNPTAPPPNMAYSRTEKDLKEIINRANVALDNNPGLVQHIMAGYKGWVNSKKKDLSLPSRLLNTLNVSGNPCFFAALVLGSFIRASKKPYVWDATQPWLKFICRGYAEVTNKRMLSSSVRWTAWALGAPKLEPVDYHFKHNTSKKEEPIMFDNNQVEESWKDLDPLSDPDRTVFNRATEALKWMVSFKKENTEICEELLKAFRLHTQGKSIPRKTREILNLLRRKPSKFSCLLLSMLTPDEDVVSADIIRLYARLFGHDLNHNQLMMCARIMNLKKPISKKVLKPTTISVPEVVQLEQQPDEVVQVEQPEPILPPLPTEPEDVTTGDCEAPSPEIFIPANKGCNIRVTQSEGTIEITISFK